MAYTENGIAAVKKGDFSAAEKCFLEGFMVHGENLAGANLAAMIFDTRINEKTDLNVCKAAYLWYMTKDNIISSEHKLGVTLFGVGNEEIKSVARKMIKNASEKNYQPAICVMGVLACAAKDYDAAIGYFSRYEKIKNDKRALQMYAEALAAKGIGSTEKLKEIYLACAENFNDAKSYFELAKLCANGINDTEYLSYLRKAMELNYIPAFFNYGIAMFELSDYEQALPALHRAFDGGEKEAAKYLGIMYGNGYGCVTDPSKSHFYFDEATNSGIECWLEQADVAFKIKNEEWELFSLINAYNIGKKEKIIRYFEIEYNHNADNEEKESELVELALECVKLGFSSFEVNKTLGMAFLFGKGNVEKDVDRGIRYLMQCKTDPYCAEIVGLTAAYGETEIVKPVDAEEYLNISAGAGSVLSILVLGKLYRQWRLYGKAANNFYKAYNLGSSEAAEILSEMFLKGEVTGRKDKKQAALWAERAKLK